MQIDKLSFAYGKQNPLLKEISFAIPPGAITTIIGPNGSGKSTLLNVLAALNLPTAGSIVLDGKELRDYSPRQIARKLAMVHQHNSAPGDMTVEKLVTFGRLPHKSLLSPGRQEDDEAIDWALNCTNLQHKRGHALAELSGGERQRVWLALALAQRTPYLLMDEPTTYLDIYYQYEMLDWTRALNREHGLTVVMVLHDINQAIQYSDHLIIMKDGEAVLAGKPEDVITPEAIMDVYGVEVAVKREAETGMYIVPLRPHAQSSGKRG